MAGSSEPGRREQILEVARATAKAHGYTGLNFRTLAAEVGITSASLHYHFATKADLGEALARQYRELAAAELTDLAMSVPALPARMAAYVAIFRRALEEGNRMCLASQLGAECDDLPQPVRNEVAAFAGLNVGWLARVLAEGGLASKVAGRRAQAIYAAVSGAQLVARARGDISAYDEAIAALREAGLIA